MELLSVLRAETKLGGIVMKPDYDYCYECSGYGDDCYLNDDGELQCRCETCLFNNWNDEDYNE